MSKALLFAAVACAVVASVAGTGTVVDAIANNKNLTVLASLLKAVGLVEPLSGAGPFTVFGASHVSPCSRRNFGRKPAPL